MSALSDTPDSTHQLFESGVSDKGDIQNVQGRGACRTGLKTTALEQNKRVRRQWSKLINSWVDIKKDKQ